MQPYGYPRIWLLRLPPRMEISHSTMNYRNSNKVYHFEKINQFNEREIPKQSIFPGSDPKLYASCDVISILLSRNFLIEKIEEYSTPSN